MNRKNKRHFNKRKHIGYILLFIIFCINTASYSQLQEVSLEKCIDIAMQNHPDLKASYEERKEAIAKYRFAQATNKPQINVELKTVEYLEKDSENSNMINIPGRDSHFALFAGPTLIYNLIDPKKSYIEDSKRLIVDLKKMKIIKTREGIVCNVKTSYYGYSSAIETWKLMEELVSKFKIKLDRAKLLYKTGQRPVLDVTKAEVDLANARLEYEKAHNSVNLMKTKLLADMGIIDDEIEFATITVDKLPDLRFDLKELNKLSEDYYPDIKIAKLRKMISKINISTAKAGHMPTVDLLASFGFENDTIENWKTAEERKRQFHKDSWDPRGHIGLSVKMPIDFLSGGGIAAKVDVAIAQYNKMKYLEKKVQVMMRAMVRNYYNTMNELKKQIEISVPIIDNAKKHLMLAQKSYESGISSQLDMQDAEMAVLKAKQNLLIARFEYLITLSKLSNVIGLGEEYICVKKEKE